MNKKYKIVNNKNGYILYVQKYEFEKQNYCFIKVNLHNLNNSVQINGFFGGPNKFKKIHNSLIRN